MILNFFHSISSAIKDLMNTKEMEDKSVSVFSFCMFYKGVGILGTSNHAFFHFRGLKLLFPVLSRRNLKFHSHHLTHTFWMRAGFSLHLRGGGGFLTRSGHLGV